MLQKINHLKCLMHMISPQKHCHQPPKPLKVKYEAFRPLLALKTGRRLECSGGGSPLWTDVGFWRACLCGI